jgi:hypothetical protein
MCAESMSLKQKKPVRPTRHYTLHLAPPVATQVDALCNLYPHKRCEEVLGDLVGLGLTQIERLWPHATAGDAVFVADPGQSVFLPTGPFDEFHGLVRKRHDALAAPDRKDTTSSLAAPSGLPHNP